jgi:hypothetical protein
MKISQVFLAAILISGTTAFAAAPRHQDLTPEQKKEIASYQKSVKAFSKAFSLFSTPAIQTPSRPFSEIENAGYLFFSSDYDFDSFNAKIEMARNLPDGVQLVIFAEPNADKNSILSNYKNVIDPSRITVVGIPKATRGFWARDGLPVPAISKNSELALVDAKYYHKFEPDQFLAKWLGASLIKHSYYFEGGNFITNDNGTCITINNDLSTDIPDDLFANDYGCTNLIRLPFEKGIGHADESVRFVNSDTVMTDSPTYATALEAKGFKTMLLPRPSGELETYVNSLLVNGTIYVPIFNEKSDQVALDVYKKTGWTVVPLNSVQLSNDGAGSIHCITMTYPKIPKKILLKALGAKEL